MLCFCLDSTFSHAQSGRKRPKLRGGNESSSQWWVGISGGVNLTDPNVVEQFDVFSFTNDPASGNAEKKYKQYAPVSYQFGFMLAFEFIPNLSAAIHPSISTYKYQFERSYNWASSENAAQNVEIDYLQTSDLQYAELPLTFRYQLYAGKTKPYLQAGGYIGHLIKSTKTVEERTIDNATGANTITERNEYAGNAEDFYIKPNWGILAGLGVTQNIGNARFGLEINYRIGMNNITDVKNRYADSQFLTGTFTAQDDIKLNNLAFSLICVIPLKFITSKDYVPL